MLVSKKMAAAAGGASMVRKMFEEGSRLKAEFGAENVYDFSLGNPDVPPPPLFKETLINLAKADNPGSHGYMSNAGWASVRVKIADYLTKEQGQDLKNPFAPEHIVMTVGAAGALNVIFRAILDPEDEIVVQRPYFMEYNFYAENHQAKIVATEPGEGFHLNLAAISEAITPATRVVLINSPHNPTGVVYNAAELAELGKLLTAKSKENGRPIYLVSDEPYRRLVYGGVKVPSVFSFYAHSIIAYSYSKEMSVPGERIGYLAINPDLEGAEPLIDALSMANRIWGFVNAPSLMQLVLAELQGAGVELGIYEERRNFMVENLQKIGYELTPPEGAFYLFPRSPLADDLAFVNLLKEGNVLTVPGRAFAAPGYFRICYCVGMDTIRNSLPGFAKAFEKAQKM